MVSGMSLEVDHKRGVAWVRGRPAAVEEGRKEFQNKLASLFPGDFLAVSKTTTVVLQPNNVPSIIYAIFMFCSCRFCNSPVCTCRPGLYTENEECLGRFRSVFETKPKINETESRIPNTYQSVSRRNQLKSQHLKGLSVHVLVSHVTA